MQKFQHAAIMSDGDNTLLAKNHQIPQRNLDAIHRFVGQGGSFVLATGRPIHGARFVVQQLPQPLLGVYFNGALIYDHSSGKRIHMDPLPSGMNQVAAYVMQTYPNIGIECFTMNDAWIIQNSPYTRFHFRLLQEEVRFLSVHGIPQDGILKMFMTGDRTELDIVRGELLTRFPQQFHAVRSGDHYLEIFSNTSSKGVAVDVLREHFQRKRLIYAIGDSFNDIPMLKAADRAFAPADGEESVHKLCQVVCPCDDGSVADVIEHLEASL